MALDMEVGLSPGHIVLYGDPGTFPKNGAEPPPPIFGQFLLWPNGCMHQDAIWHGGLLEAGLSPGDFVLDWDPLPPSEKGGGAPNFRPMSIVAKRLHGSRCRLVRR